MAPIKWDAYRSLNITSRDSGGMTCVGKTKYGKRCRCDIPDRKFSRVCSILDEFETKAPANAISSLEPLARLSLCEEFHQYQISEKVDEWEIAIEEATQFYESGKGLKEKNRELKEMLKEERLEREELEQKFEAEISRRDQELESIDSMSKKVSSLRAKLKQSENELRIATKENDQIGFSLQKAEEARDTLSEEKRHLHARLSIEVQNIKAINDDKAQLEENYTGLVKEVETLNAQLTSERHNVAKLRQSLQTATENLSSTHSQLSAIKEDFCHNKDELEKLQVEFAKARDDSEEERQKLRTHQVASLARIDELIEKMAYAKLHPFRTFFMNLFEVTIGGGKSVFARFGRLWTRKALEPPTLEGNMSSP